MLLFILLALILLVQVPDVQTAVARKFIDNLQEDIDGKIEVGSIGFVPGNGLMIKDVCILDTKTQPADTFCYARSIIASCTIRGLIGDHPCLRNVKVSDAGLHLVSENDELYSTNLQRIFRMTPSEDDTPPGPETVFEINQVRVRNFRFHLTNENVDSTYVAPEFGFDWTDFDATANVDAHDLKFADGRMYGVADDVSASSSCGFNIHHLEASTVVGRGRAQIDNIKFDDSWSEVNIKQLAFDFKDASAWGNFVDEVKITGLLEKSRVSFQTIRYFASALKDNMITLDIEDGGVVEGPVSALRVKNLRFHDRLTDVDGNIRHCNIDYLPDVEKMLLDFDIYNLASTTKAAGDFVNNFAPSAHMDISKLAQGTRLNFSGKGHGTLNNLHLDGNLNAGSLGKAKADLLFGELISSSPIRISGQVDANNLQVGKLLAINSVSNATLSARFDATLASSGPQLDLDSLNVSKLGLLGYEYSGIHGHGSYRANEIRGNLTSQDPNLKLHLNASKAGDKIKVKGNIDRADLRVLGLSKLAAGVTFVSGIVDANINSLANNALDGDVDLKNLHFAMGGNVQNIGDIAVQARGKGGINDIILNADFADGHFVGSGRKMDLSLAVHDRKNLVSIFVPELYVADNSMVSFHTDGDGSLVGTLRSPKVSYQDYSLGNVNIDFDNSQGNVSADVRVGKALIGDLAIKNPQIKIEGRYEMEDGNYHLETVRDSSFIRFNEQKWALGDSRLSFGKDGINAEDFSLRNGLQIISANGALASGRSDTLHIAMANITPSITDDFLSSPLGIDARINGKAMLSSPEGKMNLSADVVCDSVVVQDFHAGTINLKASMKDNLLGFSANNDKDNLKLIEALGSFDMGSNLLDAKATMSHFNLDLVQPFVSGIFSEMSGGISGNILAKGPLDNLLLKSDSLRFENSLLRLAYTNVPYTINGGAEVDNESLSLRKVSIKDDENGTGELSGKVSFKNFKDLGVDASLRLKELKLINTDIDRSDEGFYGKAYASGMARVKGPLDALNIDVKATTAKQSQVHVPLSGSYASEAKLLSFKTPEVIDSLGMNKVEKKTDTKTNNMVANVQLNIQDNLEALVEIDKGQGHGINARGEGVITVEYKARGNSLDLGGDFNISNGKYHFSAVNGVIQKDFNIQPGSSIRLNGTPANTSFDISALYTQKASIAPLTADTTSVANRRTVECGINISNKLSDPKLKFSIDIPDLDPGTQTQVQSSLNTDDKVQKQFLALLLTGNFIPSEQSGVVFNGGNAVFSNLSNIMSGQINNILSQLKIPIDMGLNYSQNEAGNNIFDVAVSTQLFNNRVLVNGSLGNRQNSSDKANVIGDLDIEVKIDKGGKYRAKVFSHSADDYTNFLDNTQRNGVGFTYQTEFNTFKQFFSNIFTSKKKRQQRDADRMRQRQKMKTVVIN